VSWRLRELGRETLLNLRPVHLVVALVIGTGAWIGAAPDVAAVDRMISEFRQRVEAGGTVWVLEAEAGFPSRRCERLASAVSSIRASGSILQPRSETPTVMQFVQSPDVAYPLLGVTPGLVTVAAGGPVGTATGATIGGGIAGELGVATGSVLQTTDGRTFPITRIVPTRVRDLGFGRDILAIAPPVRAASACWFETEPWAPESTPELAQGLVALSDREVTLSPYSRDPVSALEAVAELRQRETRYAVIVTTGLLVVVIPGWVLIRRRVITAYRVANTTTSERLLILGGELAIVTVAGGLIAVAGIASKADTTEAFAVGAWAVMVAVPAALLAGTVTAVVLGQRRIDRALKD
jgi:hypothetical protein